MSTRSFLANLRERLADPTLGATLSRSLSGTRGKRAKAIAAIPDYESLRERAAAIRDLPATQREDLVATFTARARADGFTVTFASTAAEACATVAGILSSHDAKRVVKGKSMISEEIALNKALMEKGIEAIETDLGEWIVQLRGRGAVAHHRSGAASES